MKKILLLGASALFVLGACGVDKEGTGDKLVTDLEKASGQSYTSDQKDCLKGIIKDMSDDEITALSENKASEEAQASFGQAVLGCVSGETSTDESVVDGGTDETVVDGEVEETILES